MNGRQELWDLQARHTPQAIKHHCICSYKEFRTWHNGLMYQLLELTQFSYCVSHVSHFPKQKENRIPLPQGLSVWIAQSKIIHGHLLVQLGSLGILHTGQLCTSRFTSSAQHQCQCRRSGWWHIPHQTCAGETIIC